VLYPAGSVSSVNPSVNHTSAFRGAVPAPPPPPPPAGPGSLDQKLVVLTDDEAAGYGAKCLDGTPPAIYYAPARGAANQDKWVLYFKGGGWCFDQQSCAGRSIGVLGTSSVLPSDLKDTWDKTSGPLHPDAAVNPTFANFHRVLLWYCDGVRVLLFVLPFCVFVLLCQHGAARRRVCVCVYVCVCVCVRVCLLARLLVHISCRTFRCTHPFILNLSATMARFLALRSSS
jgi:hypothetical protein